MWRFGRQRRSEMSTPGAQRRIEATPAQVFAVLADGGLYPVWGGGASRMRGVDASWPSPGARLHHSFGVWPMLIDDETTMLEWQPDQRVVMEAKGWPLGTARVVLTVEEDGPAGSIVTLVEDASRGPAALMPKPA